MGERRNYREAIERHAERIRQHSQREREAGVEHPVFERPLTHEEARQISVETALRKERRDP